MIESIIDERADKNMDVPDHVYIIMTMDERMI
jgi:hypothetical protein